MYSEMTYTDTHACTHTHDQQEMTSLRNSNSIFGVIIVRRAQVQSQMKKSIILCSLSRCCEVFYFIICSVFVQNKWTNIENCTVSIKWTMNQFARIILFFFKTDRQRRQMTSLLNTNWNFRFFLTFLSVFIWLKIQICVFILGRFVIVKWIINSIWCIDSYKIWFSHSYYSHLTNHRSLILCKIRIFVLQSKLQFISLTLTNLCLQRHF